MPPTPVRQAAKRQEAPSSEKETAAAKRSRLEGGAEDSIARSPQKKEGANVEMMDPSAPMLIMPAVSLEEFTQFLQCQLKKEVEVHLKKHLTLQDPGAKAMWDDYEAFVRPNLGGTERWVPYHTVLGKHEKFLMEAVHHGKHGWSEFQRFQAIFIFRAHCKCDLFSDAQVPVMETPGFWSDPLEAFAVDGIMEKAILEYRQTTKKPLLTLCFRMIPDRILEDDDANLVRNIILRTQSLLKIAEKAYPIVKEEGWTAADKFEEISTLIQSAHRLGETWAKMLAVCIDLAYPQIGLLASQCDVGVGALAPLRKLLPSGGPTDHQEALEDLRGTFNAADKLPTGDHFWALLDSAEWELRRHFQHLPLILEQTNTKRGGLTAGTLQVQLCEYRQYRNALARNRYDLPCDESLKEAEKEKKLNAQSYMKRDLDEKVVAFPLDPKQKGVEKEDRKMFKVSLEAAAGKWKLAERIAILCMNKLAGGCSEAEAEAFCEELTSNCVVGAEDVPEDNAAWDHCRVNFGHPSPLARFHYPVKGKREPFQTTVQASGGPMEAERLARLCYAKFEEGADKDQVLEYRSKLYAQVQQVSSQRKLEVTRRANPLLQRFGRPPQQPGLAKLSFFKPSQQQVAAGATAVTAEEKLHELQQERLLRILAKQTPSYLARKAKALRQRGVDPLRAVARVALST